MKIVSNLNGNTKTTSYGDKLYFRSSPNAAYTQVKRGFFKDISVNPNAQFTQFYLYDETAPIINITSAGGVVTNASYTLTGNIVETQSGVASVKINGISISFSNNSFSYNVNLNYGINSFSVVVTDNAGNVGSIVHTVNLKNASVITWADEMTMDVTYGGGQYVGWLRGGTSGPYYTGNRGSNNASVRGSSWAARGQNEYVADSCWALQTTTGRIYSGSKTLTIDFSRSWRAEGGNTIGLPTEYTYIYNSAGTVVAELGNGTFDISAYNDGSYYYKIYRGSGSYGAWEGGECASGGTVTITP